MDTLQRASTLASLMVRHACAYGDLIADDVSTGLDALRRRLMVGVILVSAGLFAVAMACVLAIAVAWDTAARLWLIGGLLVVFALVATWALVTLRRLRGDSQGLLPRSGTEWQKDRVLLEQLLPAVRDSVP
jgi:uncharacterized membrane protein YqjE